ncbi:MAG TPA: hypothetical protein PLT51_00445 [Candidatus Dojkabacteria bacterium]|nr:hypothetical protein [Candidatus Dojkabacteria bacterium]
MALIIFKIGKDLEKRYFRIKVDDEYFIFEKKEPEKLEKLEQKPPDHPFFFLIDHEILDEADIEFLKTLKEDDQIEVGISIIELKKQIAKEKKKLIEQGYDDYMAEIMAIEKVNPFL